ncbi:peptidoglycan DD-metalloendopeptidase family protein [Microbacterium sp. BWT-G7]|uniref:Peptidoglycan DD-metalloendopeptidase family protein n=1 Tax=Microbacterium allomyrinae TaxID=2830666 RepID=A0A9X1LSP7_9MICO|nr:peptidoglycan DD-metalloendopeptidase family protein [Microbacterium allomyrinae]
MAEPAPTRRSSRTPATPVQATPENTGASRVSRRQATGSTPERPTVVWSRASDAKRADGSVPSTPLADLPVTATDSSVASEHPASRLPAPEPVSAPVTADVPAPAPSTIEQSSTPVSVIEPIFPVAAAAAVVAASVVVASAPGAPLSRRARRAPQAAAKPVVVPPIAPVAPAEAARQAPVFQAELPTADAPAPLLETVLAPAEPFELLETVVSPAEPLGLAEPQPDAPATASIPRIDASAADEFEAAARLFSFTGETPVQAAPTADDGADAGPSPRTQTHGVSRRERTGRGASFRRIATASFSIGVLGIVGLMTVGMTTPAQAVAAANGVDASLSVIAPTVGSTTALDEDEIQAYVAPAGVQADTLERTENYGTTTMAELASEAGIQNFSNLFYNDPNSNIQWPFAVGVTMSYGFGMRSGSMHEGIDFTPGAGAPVQAIADGTVRVASEAGGAYGVHVIIDHMIDGELVSSHYAHMQYGSLEVVAGQQVTVGTVLGHTGNTGRSYGAHTHFEILMNGTTAIDPMPWLREHTDGTHTVG